MIKAAVAILMAAILQGMAMRTVDKGLNSNIDGARQVVVRTADDWAKLWTQHAGERARPSVDFNKEMVIAVFMGSRPSAAFSVDITGVREQAGMLVVSYKETRPAPGSVAAQILTSPFHIVAVPKVGATAVTFEKAS